ncbi:FAD-binding and (Fe-S)-binding domain-containing protein [Wenyingzhuangia sp. IMCC45574]
MEKELKSLDGILEGEVYVDDLHQKIYATDASVYRKIPKGVAFPKSKEDLKKIIDFASKHKITLIPRTAGTSLAGQCVGEGLIVDVSKYFTSIVSYSKSLKTITVQPGVIRDDLNRFVKEDGVFFGPNTSTANRCMIGGMVGNNSSGTTSIRYGVTRDKVLSLETILSDGSEVVFKEVTRDTFIEKMQLNSLEGEIYKELYNTYQKREVQEEIKSKYPKPEIHRRNTGYAIDELLKFELFGGTEKTINLAKLLCGSEGTLAFTTEITLQLDSLPPKYSVMVASHFKSVQVCLESVNLAMQHQLYNCELMDKIILDCTKKIPSQKENRKFLQGNPAAVLMLEVAADTQEKALEKANSLIHDLETHDFGYAHPKIVGNKIKGVHELRKAGLGALGNMVGDKKAVACIEDTAVSLDDLPNFITDFTAMMVEYNQQAVYYAHAGAGEIHLRPILNLKVREDVVLFRTITTRVAALVKQYKGSLSGEHGDGIVRAEFIPMMVGAQNYQRLIELKELFDPKYIFNKGKIVHPFKMDEALRYETDSVAPEIDTLMDFSDSQGVLSLAEQCNGSGDCRKSVAAGGMMCPSYRATKEEKDTTRARANALREVLTNNKARNKFDSETLKEVFDLCVGCKACASECPSNVDVAALKSEFLYQYQEAYRYGFRNRLFASITDVNQHLSVLAGLVNLLSNTTLVKKILGVSKERTLPSLKRITLSQWIDDHFEDLQLKHPIKEVHFFNDEFINYYDVKIGIDAIELLTKLNYKCVFINHEQSGRSYISKGFLKEAKQVADENISIFSPAVSEESPLVGIEPSAILSFRDEYVRLAGDKENAKDLAKHTYTIEEFVSKEIVLGNIQSESFTNVSKEVKVHVHCHQKSLSNSKHTFDMLNIIPNYEVRLMNTGCCGMAGSFGFEQEHYEVSMQMGEDTLFPKVRKASEDTIIVASGTSCRHQIKDGTQRNSLHAVTVLREALLIDN